MCEDARSRTVRGKIIPYCIVLLKIAFERIFDKPAVFLGVM